jgi:hypothetical protein
MWSFKTMTIDNVEERIVEAAVRQFAVRRHTSLDFQSSATYIGTEKLFLGLEKETNLDITRIRSPFETLFPKLIIRFDKGVGFTRYRLRYSLLSFFVLIILLFAVLSSVIYSISNNEIESDLSTVVIFLFIFILLSFFENRLTKTKLKRALTKVKLTDFPL